eukprot:SAG22_NODE_1001_length_6086_cov_3.870887_2_plen_254_part_00
MGTPPSSSSSAAPAAPLGRQRFAAVPLKCGGLFWFAHYPTAALAAEERRAAGPAEKAAAVIRLFSDYHRPIPDLLAVAAAEGSGAGGGPNSWRWEGGLSGLPCPPRRHQAPESTGPGGGVFFVGDALQASGANLAQGAALAIEDGLHLGAAFLRTRSTNGDGQPESRSMSTVYDELRAGRRLAHARMTFATAVLADPSLVAGWAGAPNSGMLARVLATGRDTVLGSVPQPLNGWIFDTALGYSLSGNTEYQQT